MREIDKILLQIEEHIRVGSYSNVETDKIELKDLSGGIDWKELHKTTCAFLNTKGGIVVIGLKEDSKTKQFKFTGFNPNNENNIKILPTLFIDEEGRKLDLTEYVRPDLIEIKPFHTGQVCLVFIEKLPDELKYVFYKGEAYERQGTGDHRIPDAKIQKLGSRAVKAHKLLNYLYQQPMIEPAKVAEVVSVSAASAYKLVDDFEKMGILKEVTGSKRGKFYLFQKYIDIFEKSKSRKKI